MEKTEIHRDKPIPEEKKELVEKLAEKIKNSKSVLVVSTKGLPSSQFQEIKKSLRGKAEIIVAKKSIVNRSISSIEKGALQNLKKEIGADVALIFSDIDAFELSGLLSDNQSPAKAKAGDVSPEDINVEPGPTELMPGPAISELSGVGLKVAVQNGKLVIKQGRTIVKKGGVIDEKTAGVMAKLNIMPMKVGFIPIAAYDSVEDKVYLDIKIDREGDLASLREAISKALGFAANVSYVCKETIGYFIAKAGLEEKAIEMIVGREKKEGESGSEEAVSEKKEDNSEKDEVKKEGVEEEKKVESDESKENFEKTQESFKISKRTLNENSEKINYSKFSKDDTKKEIKEGEK